MKERPILFSGSMIRAILDGRKTQTRRVVKNPDAKCPYGKVGDRLWVRETYAILNLFTGNKQSGGIVFRADVGDCVQYDSYNEAGGFTISKWKPSIFMPRWASRITLEIVDIRMEHLRDISENDALSEGIITERGIIGAHCAGGVHCEVMGEIYFPPIAGYSNGYNLASEAFMDLWDSINGRTHPWNSNPLVWVVEFKQIESK